MATPHNQANVGDFAKTVLLPGDPKRAQKIAETFLEQPRLVNDVRGAQGYTGSYRGVRVSVMSSGMGMPSMGIHSYELYSFYGVQNIIRIGSAGAIMPDVKLRDIVAGVGACTDSAFAKQYGMSGSIAPIASYELLRAADDTAKGMGISLKTGNLLSSDAFYKDDGSTASWQKMGVMAVEMEAAALYLTAARLNRRALAICTISDLIYDQSVSCTAQERQDSFTQMMQLALETAVRLEELPDRELRK